jgi:putative PIN family toxin of toxin-antitoxin system
VLRVTADSNVYISALHFGGAPDDFLNLARAGSIHLTISDAIVDEVTRVLGLKFHWSSEALSMFRERVADFTETVIPTQNPNVIQEDAADNRILECAVEGRSEYLVTRDNHLLRLGSYGDTKIIKVADFLGIARALGVGGL